MNRRSQQPTDQPIRSSSRDLVATRYLPSPPRDRGEYDSSERLPSVEKLLDGTVQRIRQIHLNRKRTPKTFERLWKQVCEKLAVLGNASAYARSKQDEIVRNLDEFKKLDAAAEEAWAASLSPIDPSDENSHYALDDTQFQRLREERSRLKPEVEISTDHVLEVAIAYWVEAMNAHKSDDELRAMHALIQCHFHLGMAHSLRMTHDSKSDGGRKSGQKERDALAEVVLKVMDDLIIDRSIRGEDFLFGRISEAIAADPAHAEVLSAYDERARGGKPARDTTVERFSETLRKWILGKQQPYPKLTVQFRHLAQQIKNTSLTKNSTRRKPNG